MQKDRIHVLLDALESRLVAPDVDGQREILRRIAGLPPRELQPVLDVQMTDRSSGSRSKMVAWLYLFTELRVCGDSKMVALYEECVLNSNWRQWHVPVFALQRLWECDLKYKRWAADLLRSERVESPEAFRILRSMLFPAQIPGLPFQSRLERLRRGGEQGGSGSEDGALHRKVRRGTQEKPD